VTNKVAKATKTIYAKHCYFCGRKITARKPHTRPMPGGIKAYICTKCLRKEKACKDGSRKT